MKDSVYELYDADGECLYIGLTNHIGQRLASHEHHKPWWKDVTRIVVTHYPDEEASAAAEKTLIRSVLPRYNINFTTRQDAGWTARRAAQEARHAAGEMCSIKETLHCKQCREARQLSWEEARRLFHQEERAS